MNTVVYFVRHAESPYIEGAERARGLSEKGEADALKVQAQLKREGIQVYVSSPYQRAIQTISQAERHHEVIIVEDLKERKIGLLSSDISFKEAKRKVYQKCNQTFLTDIHVR